MSGMRQLAGPKTRYDEGSRRSARRTHVWPRGVSCSPFMRAGICPPCEDFAREEDSSNLDALATGAVFSAFICVCLWPKIKPRIDHCLVVLQRENFSRLLG